MLASLSRPSHLTAANPGEGDNMRQLRYFLGTCAFAILMAAARTGAAAPYEDARFFVEPAPVAAPAEAPQAAPPTHRPQSAHPAPRKETGRREHKNHKDNHKDEAAGHPASHNTSAAKSSERRPLFGPLSFGVETSTAVPRRSLAGGVADPERDPATGQPRQTILPSFLGLSLKSEFSW
jgi:hypothetical protein